MLLDRTIVPWSVLWLWYFEDWLATDEWRGGGLHPPDLEDGKDLADREAIRRTTSQRRLNTTS